MPATKPRELPTLAEVAPRWAELSLKALYLERQHENLLAEAEALPPVRLPAAFVPQKKAPPQPEQHRKPLSPAAKAALGDLDIPEPQAPEWHAPDPATESQLNFGDPTAQQAADLGVRLNGVREAIAAIHVALPRALAEGSRAYCDLVRDEYTERASRVCKALVELASAYTEHQDFLAQVQRAGASTAFLAPLNLESTGLPYIMGDLRAGESAVFEVLARATDGGHFAGQADAVAALRKPAPPLPPAPFAEAAADLRAAEQARIDARKGRAMVIRWSPDNRSQRFMRRSEAAKLDAARAPRAPADDVATILEPPTREGLRARVRAALRGSQSDKGAESTDDQTAA
jgi:hypothetical protein